MFNFFKKKQIKASLVKGGTQVRVAVKNVNREETLIMLFLTVKEVAKFMRMDHRQLLNKLVDLNKTIERSKKKAEKEQKKFNPNKNK